MTECAGTTAADCLPPTTCTYQNGTGGTATAMNPEINTNYDVPTTPWPMDVNGDGRDDLVYSSSATSGSGVWMVMFANTAGGYNPPTPTHTNTNYSSATPIDYDADGLDDLLVQNSGNTWSVMLGTRPDLPRPPTRAHRSPRPVKARTCARWMSMAMGTRTWSGPTCSASAAATHSLSVARAGRWRDFFGHGSRPRRSDAEQRDDRRRRIRPARPTPAIGQA